MKYSLIKNMKRVWHWALCLMLGILCSSCKTSRPDEAEVVLLFTSDVMYNILPYDFLKDRPAEVSLANFVTFAKEQREQYGQNCLVLDNGNKMLGALASGYYNYNNTEAEPLPFKTERMVGYDAVGLGDKDLDVPGIIEQKCWNPAVQPPVICANLVDASTGEPLFTPFKIFERQGLRIAVLGLMSPGILPWLTEESMHGMAVEDMIESARRWMPVIQSQNPDLVVGLCGASMEYQQHGNTLDTYKNPNGSVPTAIRVPGFDVMLMGGSSKREVFEVKNDAGEYVTCIQVGSSCTHCGQVRVEMKRDAMGEYRKNIFASVVNLAQYAPDAAYSHELEQDMEVIGQWLRQPFGVLGDTLCGGDGLYGPDAYRQLLNRAQLWFTGAEISMASCTIPNDTILPCRITPLMLFKIFPFANQIEVMEMQGLDVLRFLEYAYSLQFETIKSSDDLLLSVKHDRLGNVICDEEGHACLVNRPTDFTAAAGIRYSVDVTKPVGERVRIYSMADGRPFNLRENYKVAINSYQGKDMGNYFSLGLGWDRATIELHAVPRPQFSVRHTLQEYIKAMDGDTIHVSPFDEWRLLPEKVVAAALAQQKGMPQPVWK